jgi:hypothetical protein
VARHRFPPRGRRAPHPAEAIRDPAASRHAPRFSESGLDFSNDVGLFYLDKPAPESVAPMPLNRTRLTSKDAGDAIRFIGFGRSFVGNNGLGEKLSEVYIGPMVGGGIEIWFAYVLALVFLLFRPQGLFGEKIIDRV